MWEDYCSAALWGRRSHPAECWRSPGHEGEHHDIAACVIWDDAARGAVQAVMNPRPGRLSGRRARGREVEVRGRASPQPIWETDGD